MPSFVVTFVLRINSCGIAFRSDFELFAFPKRQQLAIESSDSTVQTLRKALEADEQTVKQLVGGGESCDDVFLKRWLISRKYNVENTVEALREHSKWRFTVFPNGRILESEIKDELESNKCFLQGCNKEGDALLIVLARRHDMSKRDFEQTQKLICYTLDVSSAVAERGGGQKICCLFDLTGLRLKNLDVKVLAAIFELLQQHYPERLGMLWFINAPFIFWAVWNLVSPLLEECSRQKIRFVSCKNQRCSSFLQDSVAEDVLPTCYGGQAELIPINVAARGGNGGILHLGGHQTAIKESWRSWYRRHTKLSKVGNWIWHLWKGSVNNKLTRSLWGKIKVHIWKEKSSPQVELPFKMIRKPSNVKEYFEFDPKQIWIKSFILKLLCIHIILLLISHARYYLMNYACSDE